MNIDDTLPYLLNFFKIKTDLLYSPNKIHENLFKKKSTWQLLMLACQTLVR